MTALKIPYDQLSPEALHGVIEEFVTRDGTDYGEHEIPLETKISKVLSQLISGKAVKVSGDHHKFKHENGKIVIVPHPQQDLPAGTARNIYKMAGLKWRK